MSVQNISLVPLGEIATPDSENAETLANDPSEPQVIRMVDDVDMDWSETDIEPSRSEDGKLSPRPFARPKKMIYMWIMLACICWSRNNKKSNLHVAKCGGTIA
jgi:hypothetical protein